MKLYIPGLLFAFAAIAFTSCEKTYKCSCYSPNNNRSTPVTEIKGTKKDAREKCESLPLTGQYTGNDYICTLK